MSRYIDIDKQVYCGIDGDYERYNIDPTATSIDIVRCRECRLGGTEDCPMDEIDDEYFCNFGEREGE